MRIPVGEAKAAAGFAAADFFRLWRAVDAVAGQVEPDPGRADGIVGPGLNDKLLGDALALRGAGQDGGVERVVGGVDQHLDAQFAARAFVDPAGDTDGAVEQQAVFGAEHLQRSFRQLNLCVGRWLADAEWRQARDANIRTFGELAPVEVRVECGDQVGVGLCLFRDHFEGRIVAHAVELTAGAPTMWLGPDLPEVL